MLGELVDTDAPYIARRLRTIGLDLFYMTTVGDNEERLALAIDLALSRADVVIVTGGLGPTVDDVTREAVARLTGRRLVLDERILAQIEARFRRWGRSMTENNRRQAHLPEGAIPIENPVGTAPGFIVEEPRGLIICLPGVPHEMEYLMEKTVLPFLRERFGLKCVIKSKTLRTCALGESTIDNLIADLMTSSNPTVGLSAHPAQTDVRITAKAESEEEADRLIAEIEEKVRQRLGLAIYGVDSQKLEEVVVGLLRKRNLTLTLVETNTAGLIAQRLQDVKGSADLLKSKLILMGEDDLKAELGLSPEFLARYGFISAETTAASAEAAHAKGKAELALAVFGTSSPNEDFYSEKTGHTFMALASSQETMGQALRFGGCTDLAQRWVSTMALDFLRRFLLAAPTSKKEADNAEKSRLKSKT